MKKKNDVIDVYMKQQKTVLCKYVIVMFMETIDKARRFRCLNDFYF